MNTSIQTKRDWETQLDRWSQPPGKTETDRCDNAVNTVKNAIERSSKLSHRTIKVFPQGSYRNRVNVRKDSDVDVGVMCSDTFLVGYPDGKSAANYNVSPATYHWPEFKNDVEEALVDYFGRPAVTRGNKAFDIKENSYHVEADVVPLFEYRQYWDNGTYRAGVALRTDRDSKQIENYPEKLLSYWPDTPLHYENGVSKNTATNIRYKSLVRIIKSLRNEMNANAISTAEPIPGFLNECLVWNCPDDCFAPYTWTERVKSTLLYLWENTKSDESCAKWCEVNGIKYLFHSSQPWTRKQAHDFIFSAWVYLEFPTN